MATARPSLGFAEDAVVPSRDTLLDEDAVTALLDRIMDHDGTLESCTLRRVRYRVGDILRVVYDVVADGRDFVMSARTFPNSEEVFLRARVRAERVLGMPGVAHDPDTQSVWWTVPNDRQLRNLGTLLDPPTRVRRSSGVLWDQSRLVEYSPEQSATARLLDAHGQVTGYAKAYVDRDAMDVATQYNRVAASIALLDGIRTPRALGWARPDRIVVLEPMRGRAWTQLPLHSQPSAMGYFGAALANVHGLPTDFGRGAFQRYRIERVLRSGDLVAQARPDVAQIINDVGEQLAEGPPEPDAMVCLHGDVHANNVLFHGDQVYMIDFDRGGSGAASADIGSLLASLLTTELTEPETAAEGLAASFLDGYGALRPVPSSAELKWYTAAALVSECALRAVNRANRTVLAVLPDVLELAGAVLAGKLGVEG
ncbi:MAG TPA: aminoglycoside phosphotransferase family protein [Ilumatobacteraceae bacterium]